jgi:hypothetical protein
MEVVEPTTITSLSLSCQKHFEGLCEALRDGELHEEAAIRTSLEDELGRFRLWASNIGAMNPRKASLDHRLRNVDYLLYNVKSLLQHLQQSLREGALSLGPLLMLQRRL